MDSPALWQKCKKGDREAFKLLYQFHIDDLMAYGRKICNDHEILEDAVHDLFVYVWEKRESLGDTDSVIRYLCVSLRRRLVKYIEDDQKVSRNIDMENHNTAQTSSAETALIIKEEENALKQKLSEAISRLPKRQQEAIHLKYYQCLSYDEICTVMDINYQSVRNLMARAMTELREFM
jgi:RNA polymerase sigma factor (sigma-70 family)